MNHSASSLIADIEAEKNLLEVLPVHAAMNIAYDRVIDLITQHMENKVIVPVNWIEVAACPDECCDNGTVAHYSEGDAEISQCQFCYEKDQMLSTKGEG